MAELAQCPRCQAWTLTGLVAGTVTVAVELLPVDPVGYGVAVRDGVELYWAEKTHDGAYKGLRPAGRSPSPSWGPNGSQTGTQTLHAEHPHSARDQKPVGKAPEGPPSAPVKPGGHRGGSHQPDAPRGAHTASQPSPAPARPVTRRRSEYVNRLCDICGKMIGSDWDFFGIRVGQRWEWVIHGECE